MHLSILQDNYAHAYLFLNTETAAGNRILTTVWFVYLYGKSLFTNFNTQYHNEKHNNSSPEIQNPSQDFNRKPTSL
jgi:hypothetical protein